LYSQAGAGIVIHSDEAKELQEVNNKLAALKKALFLAEDI
jgi:anthranilate synthase component 1